MRVRNTLARAAAATAVVAAGLAATGTAAFAADVPYYRSVSTRVGNCTLDLTSANTTMNQQTRKDIYLVTNSAAYGCTLQVFPSSTSSAYNAYVATPDFAYDTHNGSRPLYYPIHRIRICQSGDPESGFPGACSSYLWWDHEVHTS
jgi:hypothetical protein